MLCKILQVERSSDPVGWSPRYLSSCLPTLLKRCTNFECPDQRSQDDSCWQMHWLVQRKGQQGQSCRRELAEALKENGIKSGLAHASLSQSCWVPPARANPGNPRDCFPMFSEEFIERLRALADLALVFPKDGNGNAANALIWSEKGSCHRSINVYMHRCTAVKSRQLCFRRYEKNNYVKQCTYVLGTSEM